MLTLARICNPVEFVEILLLPLTSSLPPLSDTLTEPDEDDVERIWLPTTDVVPPDTPADSFMATYKPSMNATRAFCLCYETRTTFVEHPMLSGWPNMLDIPPGSVDREDLDRDILAPERHVW